MVSQTSEYALRAVVYLATRAGEGPAAAQEIAEATKVSVGYLQKVLRQLARQGILRAQRGSGGGFALAKVPTAISVLDVLRASDTPIARIERCPLGIPGHTRLCALHHLLDSEIAKSERVFSSTSIADLLQGEGGVGALCADGPVPTRVGLTLPGGVAKRQKKSG